jgi:hypothetical protein
MVSHVRSLVTAACVGTAAVIAVGGCGASGSSARGRSDAEVRAAFGRHNLRLTASSIGEAAPGVRREFLGGDGAVEFTVDLYSINRWPKKITVLLLGSGAPHIVRSRNVVARWTGPDSRRVEAAMRDLR